MINSLEYRRELLIKQKQLIIPFGLKKLEQHIPGTIPGDIVVITANSGIGKSRITRKLFIKNVLDFGKRNNIPVKIFLNSLEETKDKLDTVFIKDIIIKKQLEHEFDALDFYTLRQYRNPFTDRQYAIYKKIKKYIDDNIYDKLEICSDSVPFVFYKRIRAYLEKTGQFYYNETNLKGIIINSTKAFPSKGEKWNDYIPNQYEIVIAISDTINKYQGYAEKVFNSSTSKEQILTQYDAIKKFSNIYTGSYLSPKCGVISVLIAQQRDDSQKVMSSFGFTKSENQKEQLINKLKPSLENLKSCKAIEEDATIALGLFDPLEYNYTDYKGLDLETLNMQYNGKYRSILVLKGRESTHTVNNNEIPIMAQFDKDSFIELNFK